MFELRVPFFRPVWRRIAVTAACFGWAALEFVNGAPLWAALFCAIGALLAWQFFLTDWPETDDEAAGRE